MPPWILPAHARKTALAYASRGASPSPRAGSRTRLGAARPPRPAWRSCWSGRPTSAPPCPWAASWSSTWS
eukprot:4404067-Prymnesium_polylepis.1